MSFESSIVKHIMYEIINQNFKLELSSDIYLIAGFICGFNLSNINYIEENVRGYVVSENDFETRMWYETNHGIQLLDTDSMINHIIKLYETGDTDDFYYTICWKIPSTISFNQEYVLRYLHSIGAKFVKFECNDPTDIIELDLQERVSEDYLTPYQQQPGWIIEIRAIFSLYNVILGG